MTNRAGSGIRRAFVETMATKTRGVTSIEARNDDGKRLKSKTGSRALRY